VQNGQWSKAAGVAGSLGANSDAEDKAIQRGPALVQISISGACSPCAQASACDTVGASAPNSASHKVNHTGQGWRSMVNMGRWRLNIKCAGLGLSAVVDGLAERLA
jgi:hypothetical protein